MALENEIFDHLVDHEDRAVSYQELYNHLVQDGTLSKTRTSLGDFTTSVHSLPNNFNDVHRVYLFDDYNYRYEPALVFSSREKADMLDELYLDTHKWRYDHSIPHNSSLDTDDFDNYLDFYIDNYDHLPSHFKFSDSNNQLLFNLAKSKDTKMMERFLDLHPEALYWKNNHGDTVMDIACDVDDNDMQNLIAATLIRDKLNRKADELLVLEKKIAELQASLLRRTAEGVIAALFTGLLGYLIGRMGLGLPGLSF